MTVHCTDPSGSLKSITYAAGTHTINLAIALGSTARIVGIQIAALPNATPNTNNAKVAFGWQHDTLVGTLADIFFAAGLSNLDNVLQSDFAYFGQAEDPFGDPARFFAITALVAGNSNSVGQMCLPHPVHHSAIVPTGAGGGSDAAGHKDLIMFVSGNAAWLTIWYKDGPY